MCCSDFCVVWDKHCVLIVFAPGHHPMSLWTSAVVFNSLLEALIYVAATNIFRMASDRVFKY